MRPFESYNPIVITLYFLSMIVILMFSQNPVLLLIAFFGAFSYLIVRNGKKCLRSLLFYLLLFVIMTAVNPLVSHNGRTVLFFINDSPITLEATVFGAVSAGIITTVLCLFYSFSEIMTRDKLLYVFGKLSPRLALVLSMGLRYVPLLSKRSKMISETQRALGLYKDDNIIDKIKSNLRVFSVLVSWALENGITTADSMSARGYGKGKRTYYSLFRFRRSDAFILILTLIGATVTLCGIGCSALEYKFYPSIAAPSLTPLVAASYVSYGILAILPILTETEERLKWKYLQSKI